MKITKKQLKQIIAEELEKALMTEWDDGPGPNKRRLRGRLAERWKFQPLPNQTPEESQVIEVIRTLYRAMQRGGNPTPEQMSAVKALKAAGVWYKGLDMADQRTKHQQHRAVVAPPDRAKVVATVKKLMSP